MFYIGGVLAGSGQVSYTISDMDLPWVVRQACHAWQAARAVDRDATWFVAPLTDVPEPVAVLDPEAIREGLRGDCKGC